MKKIILVAIAVLMLAGVTPALAQPVGTWSGEGDGWCPFPVPYPSEYMKPWQTWKGRFEPNPEEIGYIFYGEWHDGDGNYGTFKGEAILGTPTEISCTGTWTWWDERLDPPRVYEMGNFTMLFRRDGSSCEGDWYDTIDPSGIYHGTMKGYWVEP